ncbi:MAG: hypothetical protein ACXAEN_26135 [Candidatus Thorarchaeota archaeon]|jgi:hypothetical protein
MALFGGGDELIAQIKLSAKLEAEVEHLKRENEKLWKSNDQLREALMAKESPEAYNQLQSDRFDIEQPAPNEDDELKAKTQRRMAEEWDGLIDRPMFEDADEMCAMLLKGAGVRSESLHGNDES